MANTPLTIPDLINIGKWVDYRDPIWGDSYNWSWNRKPGEVKYLVIHHTVTDKMATPDDIALLHKARGWGGIGYHFVITNDGTVYYVGDVGTARANVLNMNEKVIGISLVGDFTKHLPSDEQIISAHYLCKFFLDNKQVWTGLVDWETSLKGHKDLQATACPGNDWHDTASSLFNRIKDKIPYTPQDPTEPVDPPVDECEERYTTLDAQFTEYKEATEPKVKLLTDVLSKIGATDKNALDVSQKLLDDSAELVELKKAQNEAPKPSIEMYDTNELIGIVISRILPFIKPKG